MTRTTTPRTVAALQARAARLAAVSTPATLTDSVRLLCQHGRSVRLGQGHVCCQDAARRWVRLTRAGGTMPTLHQLLRWLVS